MMHNCKRCGKQFKWDKHYQNHNQRVNPCKDKRTEINNMDEDKINRLKNQVRINKK